MSDLDSGNNTPPLDEKKAHFDGHQTQHHEFVPVIPEGKNIHLETVVRPHLPHTLESMSGVVRTRWGGSLDLSGRPASRVCRATSAGRSSRA